MHTPIKFPEEKRKSLFTSEELRLITVSLTILSLGLAIAYLGFFFFHK